MNDNEEFFIYWQTGNIMIQITGFPHNHPIHFRQIEAFYAFPPVSDISISYITELVEEQAVTVWWFRL